MVEGPPAEPLIVLLVEDNPGDAALMTSRLQLGGGTSSAPVHLLHAESVIAASTLLQRAAVDVVILDLSLPDAGGVEALHQVRAVAPGVPIIVLTSTADEAAALEALRAGAQDYVLKPPPDGVTLRRILGYARERQHLLLKLDVAVRDSVTAARRWRLLAEIGKALTASLEPGAAIGEIAGLVVPDAADCFLLYLIGDEIVPTLVEVAHVDSSRTPELRQRMRDLLTGREAVADQLFGALYSAGATTAVAPWVATPPLLAALEAASGVTVPLHLSGRVRGLIVLATSGESPDVPVDVEFARSLADRISLELERARSFSQTRRAVAASDRAVGIVSHDLRNPLSTIQICATALLDPEPPPLEGIRQMGRIIQRSAAWMQQIAQDLLDRSSLDAGRLALEREPTSASAVIGSAQVIFAPVAEEHELEFVVESGADLPPVNADPRRLQQVLSNLLSNAMKFTPAGGCVVLSARVASAEEAAEVWTSGTPPAGVRFTVSDTGPGIPAADLVHVFDWFWHSRAEGRTGTGLGLAIAQGLIVAHHGFLHVESVPGEGSSFWFTMPAAEDEPAGVTPDAWVQA
jgi:signal transduction histidine kinase/ActR/RegA family two-component response regulator